MVEIAHRGPPNDHWLTGVQLFVDENLVTIMSGDQDHKTVVFSPSYMRDTSPFRNRIGSDITLPYDHFSPSLRVIGTYTIISFMRFANHQHFIIVRNIDMGTHF